MSTKPTQLLEEIGKEDRGVMLSLIEMYKEQTPESILLIEKFITQEEGQSLKEAAHTLKGTCLNLGFEQIAHICLEIEQSASHRNFKNAHNLLENLKSEHKSVCQHLKDL